MRLIPLSQSRLVPRMAQKPNPGHATPLLNLYLGSPLLSLASVLLYSPNSTYFKYLIVKSFILINYIYIIQILEIAH